MPKGDVVRTPLSARRVFSLTLTVDSSLLARLAQRTRHFHCELTQERDAAIYAGFDAESEKLAYRMLKVFGFASSGRDLDAGGDY
jgi:hypothetical protein